MKSLIVVYSIILNVLLLFGNVSCFAGVIFRDNFDDHSDWQPEQLLTKDYAVGNGAIDGTARCSATSEGIGCPNGKAMYFGYYVAMSAWPDYKGNNTLNISSFNARGGVGKALTLWMEPIDATRCDGGSKWCSDGQLSIALPKPYNDLYVRYYIKFQPGWRWNSTQGVGAAGKFLRVSHFHDIKGVATYKFFKSGNHFPLFILDLTNQTYFVGDGSDPFAEVHMHPRFQSVYYGDKNIPTPDFLVNWDFERIRVGTGGTGYNGHITFDEFLSDGKWHMIVLHLKGNSKMGVADGMYELTIDNDVIVSRNNIAWAGSYSDPDCTNCVKPPQDFVGWNWVSIGGNMYNGVYPSNVREEQWYAIDDLVISDEPLGAEFPLIRGVEDITGK